MKSIVLFILGILLGCLVALIALIATKETLTSNNYEVETSKPTTIVWNDDEESIPMDNSLITLEFTKDGVIYVGPYDENADIN